MRQIAQSPFGYTLRMIRDNATRASFVGIDVYEAAGGAVGGKTRAGLRHRQRPRCVVNQSTAALGHLDLVNTPATVLPASNAIRQTSVRPW